MFVPGEARCATGEEVCLRGRYVPYHPLYSIYTSSNIPSKDYRKLQPRLLTFWPYIPIEVAPIAAQSVLTSLKALGSHDPQIRLNPLAKSGPLKTDQDFYIIDAPFPEALLTTADVNEAAMGESQAAQDGQTEGAEGGKKWTVDALAEKICKIT